MPSPTFETLKYTVDDAVAVITLHRPDRMNALNAQMIHDLIAAFDETDRDDDVRAVIVTGSGDRAFCAGADLASGGAAFDRTDPNAIEGDDGRVGDVYRDGGGRVSLRIFESLKPVIAAVNGAAVGIGATMLLPMDIRLASTSARFGFVFARRGITPEAGSTWFLPRLVGMQHALEWCFTGRLVPAEEALARDLIRSSHPPAELLPAAMALAREIAESAAPVSVALTRRMLWRGACLDHPMEAHQAESRALQSRGSALDAKEGIAAFLEKRPPAFTNRVSEDMPDVFPDWRTREFR